MSRLLHLDLVGGIAGDMAVAALVDAGADWDELLRRLAASGLPTVAVSTERSWRGGLAGRRFIVPAEVEPPARTWPEIRALLQAATLPDRARAFALAAFQALADAECAVHGCAPEELHFHEVGAMDSIVDIVAAALAVDLLDVGACTCGEVPVCVGTVRGDHGVLPLPAPATAWLLRGFTLTPIPGALETVTPTGAALLAVLCPRPDDRVPRPPRMRLLATGVGMGTAELADRPNVLRALLGDEGAERRDDAVVLEATIDDMDPRLYGPAVERLFAAGALDVALGAVQMKKGRPGTLVTVVARPEAEDALLRCFFRETTTIGVRRHTVRRAEAARRIDTVQTAFGAIRIKVSAWAGERVQATPEFDDCVAAAERAGVPVADVLRAAIAASEP